MDEGERGTQKLKSINRIPIQLSSCVLELFVRDSSIALLFSKIFAVADIKSDSDFARLRQIVLIDGFGPYELWVNGIPVANGLNRTAVLTLAMCRIENLLLSNLDEFEYVMHASSVSYRGRQVAFVGASGSGKTSIALTFSQYGSFIGDECGFLNVTLGSLRYEPFPFQLKATNYALLEKYDASRMIEIEDPNHGRAFYVARTEVDCYGGPDYGELIGAIVFPKYDPEARATTIAKASFSSLPIGILGSLFGKERPSRSLARFLNMSNAGCILFLDVRFSDVDNASACLDVFLTEEGW